MTAALGIPFLVGLRALGRHSLSRRPRPGRPRPHLPPGRRRRRPASRPTRTPSPGPCGRSSAARGSTPPGCASRPSRAAGSTGTPASTWPGSRWSSARRSPSPTPGSSPTPPSSSSPGASWSTTATPSWWRAGRTPRATLRADIVGHSCYADQIVLGARLPEVEAGDVIALLETGAYQESSASNFNALPRPATVLVSGAEAEVVKIGGDHRGRLRPRPGPRAPADRPAGRRRPGKRPRR